MGVAPSAIVPQRIAAMMLQKSFETHDIFNQSPPFENVDLFASDRPLQDAVAANGAGGQAAAPSEVARAARYFMAAQVENGHQCPITMTRACVGALGVEPALLERLIGKIVSRTYDPRFVPWWEKDGIT